MTHKVERLKPLKNDWYFKWSVLFDEIVKEFVKGPLKYPMIAIPFPFVVEDDAESKKCKCWQWTRGYYKKLGIPDPWEEYLIQKEAERRNDTVDIPKHDTDITKSLAEDYHLYFGQGIPDPWKKFISMMPTPGSNFENYKRDFKNYISSLGTRPFPSTFNVEKTICPNCNKDLLVLFVGNSEEHKYRFDKEVTPVNNENILERKIRMKDAYTDTQELKESFGRRNSEEEKYCGCCRRKENNRHGRHLCTAPESNAIYKCNSHDNSDNYFMCAQNRRHPWPTRLCAHHMTPFLPHVVSWPNKNLEEIPKGHGHPNNGFPILKGWFCLWPTPPFCSHHDNSPPILFGYDDLHNYHMKLGWFCSKCDKKKRRKKRRKKRMLADLVTHKREECVPCYCDKFKQMKSSNKDKPLCFSHYKKLDEDDSDSIAIKMPKSSFNKFEFGKMNLREKMDNSRIRFARPLCHCDEETSANSKTEDKEYMKLLDMFGCKKEHHGKYFDDNDESKLNQNGVNGERTANEISRQVINANLPTTSVRNANFSHWKYPKERVNENDSLKDYKSDSITQKINSLISNRIKNEMPTKKPEYILRGTSNSTNSAEEAHRLRNVWWRNYNPYVKDMKSFTYDKTQDKSYTDDSPSTSKVKHETQNTLKEEKSVNDYIKEETIGRNLRPEMSPDRKSLKKRSTVLSHSKKRY